MTGAQQAGHLRRPPGRDRVVGRADRLVVERRARRATRARLLVAIAVGARRPGRPSPGAPVPLLRSVEAAGVLLDDRAREADPAEEPRPLGRRRTSGRPLIAASAASRSRRPHATPPISCRTDARLASTRGLDMPEPCCRLVTRTRLVEQPPARTHRPTVPEMSRPAARRLNPSSSGSLRASPRATTALRLRRPTAAGRRRPHPSVHRHVSGARLGGSGSGRGSSFGGRGRTSRPDGHIFRILGGRKGAECEHVLGRPRTPGRPFGQRLPRRRRPASRSRPGCGSASSGRSTSSPSAHRRRVCGVGSTPPSRSDGAGGATPSSPSSQGATGSRRWSSRGEILVTELTWADRGVRATSQRRGLRERRARLSRPREPARPAGHVRADDDRSTSRTPSASCGPRVRRLADPHRPARPGHQAVQRRRRSPADRRRSTGVRPRTRRGDGDRCAGSPSSTPASTARCGPTAG